MRINSNRMIYYRRSWLHDDLHTSAGKQQKIKNKTIINVVRVCSTASCLLFRFFVLFFVSRRKLCSSVIIYGRYCLGNEGRARVSSPTKNENKNRRNTAASSKSDDKNNMLKRPRRVVVVHTRCNMITAVGLDRSEKSNDKRVADETGADENNRYVIHYKLFY